MLRKTTLAMAVALTLAPAAGYGLGLGEIRSSSLMGNVFEGAIELTDVSADEVPNIRVRLASPEAFRKAGVEYTSPVRRLRFKPFVQANGRPAVRVTSKESIREPYLNFLVEVEWSQGRTLKEYTVLLDPPTYTDRRAPQVQPPVAAPRDAPPTPAPAARPAPGSQPKAAAAAPPLAAEGPDYGPVKEGETLWRIAERNRARGVSAEQTMIAILQANPDAFVGGNINRLKAGAKLKLPSAQQYAAVDPLQARDDYLRQMGRPVPERRPFRTPAPTPPPPPAPAAPDGDLVRLVTPAPESTAAAKLPAPQGADAAGAAVLRQEVLLAHEKAESARQTADQLQGRVTDLETQVHDLQRLLVLKESQLAQLQQKAEETLKAAPPPAAPMPVDVPAPAPAPAPATDITPQGVAPAASGVPADTKPAEPAPREEAKPAEPVAPTPPVAAEPKQPAAPPVPTEPAAPVTQPKGLSGLLSDPATVLGAGIAGLGVLVALLWAIVGRRRENRAGEVARPAEPMVDAAPGAGSGPATPQPASAGPVTGVAAAGVAAFAPSLQPAPSVAEAAAEAVAKPVERVPTEDLAALQISATDLFGLKGETTEVDPTDEADVYIAYGRFEQAEQLLRLAVEMEPNQLSLRHKLLEVYSAARDAPAFGALFAQLKAAGKDAENPAAWQEALRMGRQLDPANPLYADGAAAEEALVDHGAGQADTQLVTDREWMPGRPTIGGGAGTLAAAGDSLAEGVDASSVLNDLSLDLGTEETAPDSTTHPFNLDVTEELKSITDAVHTEEAGPDSTTHPFNLDITTELKTLGESLPGISSLPVDDAAALPTAAELELAPASADSGLPSMRLQTAPVDESAVVVPDVSNIELPGEAAMALEGEETTLMHADTTLELVDDVETKLDLARAYVELGDDDSARLMLQEAMQEGNAAQKAAAEALLKELG